MQELWIFLRLFLVGHLRSVRKSHRFVIYSEIISNELAQSERVGCVSRDTDSALGLHK